MSATSNASSDFLRNFRCDCPASPIDTIPAPDQIRDRLRTIFAEARLLRSLLRVAEAKERERQACRLDPERRGRNLVS
jgi:hypothetical protein